MVTRIRRILPAVFLALLFIPVITTLEVHASAVSSHASASTVVRRAVAVTSSGKPEIIKQGAFFYYKNPAIGGIRRTAGFVECNGKLYYIYSGGKIATNITLNLNGSKYHAARDGVIQRGVHNWNGKYYFANSHNGALYTRANFATWKNRRYFIQEGGIIATNITLKKGGKQYRAYWHGAFAIGVYKWNGKLYYSDPVSGEWIKEEGFVKWNGHTYYIQENGVVISDQPFVINNKPFYAGPDGICKALPIDNPVRSSVLTVAQREVGIKTGRKYWRWYKGTRFIDTDRTPWCACFAAWCYDQAGLIRKISPAGNLAYVPCYSSLAYRRDKWINPKTARGGDLIVFGRGSRHIGIVEKVYNGYIFTIEGNSGPTAAYGSRKPGAVTRKVYKLTDDDIKGVIRVIGN